MTLRRRVDHSSIKNSTCSSGPDGEPSETPCIGLTGHRMMNLLWEALVVEAETESRVPDAWAYPKPDRSSHRPNFAKTVENDTIDIGWAEGTLSDGRPYRVECWAQDQVTCVQCYFSSDGLEELDRSGLQQFLEREGLVRFLSDHRYADGRWVSDASGNSMWEVNVVVGDEDELYAEADIPLKPYPRSN